MKISEIVFLLVLGIVAALCFVASAVTYHDIKTDYASLGFFIGTLTFGVLSIIFFFVILGEIIIANVKKQ
jgi:ABC-type thiamin/hydroxymethylpyrimidine transport system permease subunit